MFAGVSFVFAVLGVGAAWLLSEGRQRVSPATTQPATTLPAGPTTRPALLEPAEGITLTGRAICGTCFLDMGPTTTHSVVLETEEPYRTFLLAQNERLAEIEAITGSCAAGDFELTATGDVLIVNGQNVLVVRSFTHRGLDPDTTG